MEGWIKLHRKLLKWEWFSTPNMFHLFSYLLLSANFEDTNFRGKVIKRGQLITGRIKLSRETGISVKSIRTCLERLKSTSEVAIETTNKYSIITICNYDSYQADNGSSGQQNGHPSGQQRANKGPHSKNSKEVKKERIRDSNFFFSEEELESAKPENGRALPDSPEKQKEIADFLQMLNEKY